MTKPKKYIVKVKKGSRLLKTLWTNPLDSRVHRDAPTPVTFKQASAALKTAKEWWPEEEYKIVEVVE
jgi:hypothetical protein